MWVGNEGQREPRTASSCSMSSCSSRIVTPGTTRAAVAAIAASAMPQAVVISSSSSSDLTRRRPATSEPPSTTCAAGKGVLEAERRPRRRAGADGDPCRCRPGVRRPRGTARRRRPVSLTTTSSPGSLPPRWNAHEHPRQDEQRLAAGNEEGSRDPVVGIDDLAEARQVALDAGQVLEVGGRRQEEGVDPGVLEPGVQALAAHRPFSCESLVHRLESRSSAVRLARMCPSRRAVLRPAWTRASRAGGGRS